MVPLEVMTNRNRSNSPWDPLTAIGCSIVKDLVRHDRVQRHPLIHNKRPFSVPFSEPPHPRHRHPHPLRHPLRHPLPRHPQKFHLFRHISDRMSQKRQGRLLASLLQKTFEVQV